MSNEKPEHESSIHKVATRIGHSAEYSIAIALLAVCLIVGGAVWLLQPATPPSSASGDPSRRGAPATSPGAPTSGIPGADEQAALGAWKKRLEGGFDQMEQQQRRSEDERATQVRRKQEEAATARAQRQTPQPIATTPAAPAPPAMQPITPPARTPARPQPVHIDAAIDWTSCKRPVYPDSSVRRKEEGAVAVEIDLGADARVLGSRIAESSGHERLDLAAQRAIEKCRFHPATLDGLPQASTAVVRFMWKLQGQ